MSVDLFDMLGPVVAAELGSRRGTVPRRYFYSEDAPARLAEALRETAAGRRALVFFDERTRAVAGADAMGALRDAGWTVCECLIPDGAGHASPVCDDLTKAALQTRIPVADAFVAVGSGVVNDLTKWLAMDAGVPYAVLATAASMNGYSAANVAVTIKGVKGLLEGRAPVIVAARPSVIAVAPYEMTSAGLGDVIAKPVSTADWRINHRLFGESYSAAIAGIIDAVEPRYLAQPEALNPSANYLRGSAGASPSQSRDHVGQSWEGEAPAEPPGLDPVQGKAAERAKAIEALFEALVFSGCAMTLQGSSLPASGGEHLIGHTLDMLAGVDGIAHDLHGRQVGVATLFVAALYQRAMAVERPVFVPDRVPFNRALWGGIAEAVEVEYRKKIVRTREACARLARPGCWDALRREVTPMLRQPETIKECLRKAGAAHRIADIGCSRERFLMAVMNGAGIRARFTSIDLFFALGLLPDAAEGVVEEWLE